MGAHGRSYRTLCAVSADDRLAVIRLAARLGMERRRDASDASVRRDFVAACGFCDEPRSRAEGVAARSFRRIAYVARLRAVRAFSDARGWRAQGSAGQQEVGDLADGAVMDVKLHVVPTRPKKTPPQPDPLVKRTLEEALAQASPRLAPRPITVASVLIHGGVVVLWLVLFARAFFLHGVVAWSTGIAYVVYDTLLLAFVGVKSWTLVKVRKPLDR